MKLSSIFIQTVIIVLLFKLQTNAQPCSYEGITSLAKGAPGLYQPSAIPFKEVSFSIMISNSIVTIGQTNHLQCLFKNSSSNDFFYQSIPFVCLTNAQLGCHQISPKTEPPSTNGGLKINFASKYSDFYLKKIKGGQSDEWDLPFVIENNVPPENYELNASQGVITTDAKYGWELPAKALKVKVVKQ